MKKLLLILSILGLSGSQSWSQVITNSIVTVSTPAVDPRETEFNAKVAKFDGVSLEILLEKLEKQDKDVDYLRGALRKRTPKDRMEMSSLTKFVRRYNVYGNALKLVNKDAANQYNNDFEQNTGAALHALANINDPAFAPDIVGYLDSSSFELRRWSWQMIDKFKYKEAVPKLIAMLKKGGVKNRGITTILGNLGDERAVPVLLEQLGKRDESAVATALSKFGAKALPQLLKVLRDSPYPKMAEAERKGLAAIPKNADVRMGQAAASAIESMRDKEALPALWKISQDQGDPASWSALHMVLATADDTTAPTISEVRKWIQLNAQPELQIAAIVSANASKKSDVGYLIKVLQDGNVSEIDKLIALDHLDQARPEDIVPVLEEIYNQKNMSREYVTSLQHGAALRLVRLTGNPAYLLKILENQIYREDDRCIAIGAILWFKELQSDRLAGLTRQLDSYVWTPEMEAVVVPAVKGLLKDPNPKIRECAGGMLWKATGKHYDR